MFKKRSFFSRLTGGFNFREPQYDEYDDFEDFEEYDDEYDEHHDDFDEENEDTSDELEWQQANSPVEEIAELSVDMHEDDNNVVVQTMVSGIRPEDLHIDISRDSITIEGARSEASRINSDSYVLQELYWGKFSRLLALPAEVEPDHATATERNGLLTITIPKIDKKKQKKVKVKSL
jgi:HSP20 family protein